MFGNIPLVFNVHCDCRATTITNAYHAEQRSPPMTAPNPMGPGDPSTMDEFPTGDVRLFGFTLEHDPESTLNQQIQDLGGNSETSL